MTVLYSKCNINSCTWDVWKLKRLYVHVSARIDLDARWLCMSLLSSNHTQQGECDYSHLHIELTKLADLDR